MPLVVAGALLVWGAIVYLLFVRQGRGHGMRGRVLRSYAPVRTDGPAGTVQVKVHALSREFGSDGPTGPAVGLEVTSHTPIGYRMVPVTLSREEARQLAAHLEEAATRD